ncbi:hypothetical protein Tco_1262888 [Tanacetum coccineum]
MAVIEDCWFKPSREIQWNLIDLEFDKDIVQEEGIDYEESYCSNCTDRGQFRIFIAMLQPRNMNHLPMAVKTAFPNVIFQEEVFVHQLKEVEDQDNPTPRLSSEEALYGLKQATRAASRPDLVFVVCMCARYQAKPTKKHLEAIKRVFRYLKGTINMGLLVSEGQCKSLPLMQMWILRDVQEFAKKYPTKALPESVLKFLLPTTWMKILNLETPTSFKKERLSIRSVLFYKDGKVRYSFLRSRQSLRDLPRDNPLVSTESLGMIKREYNVRTRDIVPTEMELVRKYTQQGASHEVSVSTEGVEE